MLRIGEFRGRINEELEGTDSGGRLFNYDIGVILEDHYFAELKAGEGQLDTYLEHKSKEILEE